MAAVRLLSLYRGDVVGGIDVFELPNVRHGLLDSRLISRALGLPALELGEQLLELLNLIFILFEQGVLRVLVDLGLIFNSLGPRGIPQSRQGLIEIVVSGGARCNHHSLGVATKGVLQQARQLGRTVRDVL